MEISELDSKSTLKVLIKGEYSDIYYSKPYNKLVHDEYVIPEGFDRAIRFEGNYTPMKFEIEEINEISSPEYSKNYIRPSCIGRIFYNNIQIYETTRKTDYRVFRDLQDFKDSLLFNAHLDLLLGNRHYANRVIGYGQKLYKISNVLTSQGCMMLEEYTDSEQVIQPKKIKVTFHDKKIDWYPL